MQPFDQCEDCQEVQTRVQYCLVLRKWTEVNPGFEFRCFVRDKCLFAVTQRDGTNFYKHIGNEKESILNDISSFYKEQLEQKFELSHFVFDVVRPAKDIVKLVDLNPFGPCTDSILYDWEELKRVIIND